jgi:hypothetical protein
MTTVDYEIERLEKELSYMKEKYRDVYKIYDSQLCPENKIRKIKELEDKIKELKLMKV